MISTSKLTSGDRRIRGFTLIELLVVVVLLGLVASVGLVTVGTGNQERELDNEVNRLHAVLRMASEEAIYSNTEVGVVIEDDGYAFLHFNEEESKWEPAPNNFMKTYTLPEWVTIDFKREGDEKHLAAESGPEEQSAIAESDSVQRPDFMLLSSGEVTPFVIGMEIRGEADSRVEIITNEQGEIVLPALEDEV